MTIVISLFDNNTAVSSASAFGFANTICVQSVCVLATRLRRRCGCVQTSRGLHVYFDCGTRCANPRIAYSVFQPVNLSKKVYIGGALAG
eukprot:COSAG01_NODE_32149_length_585_cov_3.403292_1_plen_88_part_01